MEVGNRWSYRELHGATSSKHPLESHTIARDETRLFTDRDSSVVGEAK